MKKIYISPKTECVALNCEHLLNQVSGTDLNMRINKTSVEGAADSRGSNGWDEE